METKKHRNDQYVFNDISVLIDHIQTKIDHLTPLKLQKSLYFLWAFYSATYGNIDYNVESEFNLQHPRYPKELFKADFQAWKYGPVIYSVYEANKNNDLNQNPIPYRPTNDLEKSVLDFINDLLDQINDVNDFGLIARSHNDRAWKNAYHNNPQKKMDNHEIKRDYIKYVNTQNKI